ncbi:MAG: hypothetical protein ACRD5Z_13555 [Bryobacteraceae bacterium]
MTHLDLASVLNLISTVAIVGALIFTALQVRAANESRQDQAALTVIQTTQNESWTRALKIVLGLPENATSKEVRAQGAAMEEALFELSIRLEPVGYMTFRHATTLKNTDELIGGVVTCIWSRARDWTQEYRRSTNNPKFNEWVEWLADRIAERRARLKPEPAYRQYRNWRGE